MIASKAKINILLFFKSKNSEWAVHRVEKSISKIVDFSLI